MLKTTELAGVRVLAEGLAFPEGPVAMTDGSVLVVELWRGRVSRVPASGGGVEVVADCGGGPNGLAIGPDYELYVCNSGINYGMVDGQLRRLGHSGGRIQRVSLATGEVRDLYTSCGDNPLLAPNDMVFDADGGMWFTDNGLGTARGRDYGGIFYAQTDGSSIAEVAPHIPDPNGIGISPDGAVLYWAETSGRRLVRRRIDKPGRLAPSAGADVGTLVRGEPVDDWSVVAGLGDPVLFDSLAVERGGRVCVGTLLHGAITVIDPQDGSVERMVLPPHLDDHAVTNICFGGFDGRTAYLTCSGNGRLVACDWPRPGLALAFNR